MEKKVVYVFEEITEDEEDTIKDFDLYETKENALKAYEERIKEVQDEFDDKDIHIDRRDKSCYIYSDHNPISVELSIYERPLL